MLDLHGHQLHRGASSAHGARHPSATDLRFIGEPSLGELDSRQERAMEESGRSPDVDAPIMPQQFPSAK
jgi:hypothetical protein